MPLSGLTLKAPARNAARRGAICASLLPMTIGALFLLQLLLPGPWASKYMFAVPLGVTFSFAAPLVAYLSQKQVQRQQPLTFARLVLLALTRSTTAHVCCGALHLLSFMFIDAGLDAEFLAVAITLHGFLWAGVTLPLTIICVLIFRAVSLTKHVGGAQAEVFS